MDGLGREEIYLKANFLFKLMAFYKSSNVRKTAQKSIAYY